MKAVIRIFRILGLAGLFFCHLSLGIDMDNLKANCGHPRHFNTSQQEIILKTYHYAKDSSFRWILPAIAWQESCAGAYPINFKDPSAGVFHAHIPGVLKKYSNLKDNSLNRNLVGQYLVSDFDFAIKIAMEELNFWKKSSRDNLKDVIKSYNKGNSWKINTKSNASAERYYEQVMKKVKILKDYMPTLEKLAVAKKIPINHQASKHPSIESKAAPKIAPAKQELAAAKKPNPSPNQKDSQVRALFNANGITSLEIPGKTSQLQDDHEEEEEQIKEEKKPAEPKFILLRE